jgi:DNA-binding GntR family transcriptional regulator
MAKTGDNKKKQIYEEIRRSIIVGELKPSDIVNEREVAARFGVSKSPARDALSWLTFEGLLKPLPRYGYMVTSFTVRDIQEAFHLRELLEVEAVRLAVDRIADEELDELELTLGPPSPADTRINRQFHMALAEASGNQKLARLIGQLLDEMERMIALDPASWDWSTVDSHRQVLRALRRRDKDAAETAWRDHIRSTRAAILEHYPVDVAIT